MNGHGGYVYILTNSKNSVLYTGVTSSLVSRIWEHHNGLGSQFARRYNCRKLVFFRPYDSIEEAILNEKRIKRWRRSWKENLINEFNPSWKDLKSEIEDFV